jgi:hypothetical protein
MEAEMNRGLQFMVAPTLMCSFLLPAYAEEQKNQATTMSVVLCERTEVNDSTLEVAKRVVAKVFYKAHIDVMWFAGCDVVPATRNYFVVVIAGEPPFGWTSAAAMGFAPIRTGTHRRAYIFMERVKLFVDLTSPKDTRQSTIGIALGYAIAHELGHLLIPDHGHAISGIMSPSWSQLEWQDAMQGRLVFFPEQVKIMQETLK